MHHDDAVALLSVTCFVLVGVVAVLLAERWHDRRRVQGAAPPAPLPEDAADWWKNGTVPPWEQS